MEVLVFKIAEMNFGINCSEIVKVMSNMREVKNIIEYDHNKYELFKLDEILQLKEDGNYHSVLLIQGGKKNYAVYIASALNIINIAVKDILIAPEYIRKIQKPLFSWGFLERENERVMLITFNYFK